MPNTQPLTADIKRQFLVRLNAWRDRGLSARCCTVLALAGCDSAEQVADRGRAYFEGFPNVGARTLQELADLAGWPAKTPLDAIACALRLSVPNPDEALEAAGDVMVALRRNRFAIVTAKRSAPAGRRQPAGRAAETPRQP